MTLALLIWKKRVESYDGRFSTLEKKVETCLAEQNSLKSDVTSLKSENSALKETVQILVNQIDSNEQHSRSECLLIHGVAENNTRTENAKLAFAAEVTQKVGVTVKEKDIKRAHRYGPPRSDGNLRPPIARFFDMRLRNKVYGEKKNCKGKGVFITENLTKRRIGIYRQATEQYGKEKVWTQEGRIFARDSAGMKLDIIT